MPMCARSPWRPLGVMEAPIPGLAGLEDHLAEVLPRSCEILGVGFLLRVRHPTLGE